MKKTILLPLFLIGSICLWGQGNQDSSSSREANSKHEQLLNSLLAQQIQTTRGAEQKPTGIQQRLIAQTYKGGSISYDTATYKYSGSRGSKFYYNTNYQSYKWQFLNDFPEEPYYVLMNRTMDVLADSIISFKNGLPRIISKAFYRADNKKDSFVRYYPGPYSNATKMTQQFNTNGYITQYNMLSRYNSSPDFYMQQIRKFWYDNSGTQILKDTLYSESGVVNKATSYHYNAQNNVDSILEYATNTNASFQIISAVTILYDTNNRITNLVTRQRVPNDTIFNIYADTLGYIGNSSIYTFFGQTTIYGGITRKARVIKFLGSNDVVDSSIQYYYNDSSNSFVPLLHTRFYNNTFGNPDSIITADYSSSDLFRSHFYYETYDDTPPTVIKNIEGPKDFSMYPNPFDQTIIIEWKSAHINQAKVSLVNILGQTVYSVNQPLATGNNTLNLPGLNKGNYIVLIQDGKGNSWKSQMIRN